MREKRSIDGYRLIVISFETGNTTNFKYYINICVSNLASAAANETQIKTLNVATYRRHRFISTLRV